MPPGVVACWAAMAVTLSVSSGAARAEFEIDYLDGDGAGFFDATVRTPLDDNRGTTLGEQRRSAFEHALEIFARALESSVPIRIEATFAPFPELPCSEQAAVLGGARAVGAFAGFDGAPDPELYYVAPLADKLAGRDLDPSEPDMIAVFNPLLDEGCLSGIGWHYGFVAGTTQAEFVNTVLHELAHGLGFTSLVDELTGDPGDGLSTFDAMLFDDDQELDWGSMTNAERAASISNPLGLVWLGEHVTRSAESLLAQGVPVLEVTGQDAIRLLAEPSFGPYLAEGEITGALEALDAAEACAGDSRLDDRVVLLALGAACPDLLQQVLAVQERGASAAVLRSEVPGAPPFGLDLVRDEVGIVVLSSTQLEFDTLSSRLEQEDSLMATLRAEPGLNGTNGAGRVLMNATDPVVPGSSVSHFDRSARRERTGPETPDNLLMEPAAAGITENRVTDLTLQLLHDVGWDPSGCGNGLLDDDEQCDDGIANSNAESDACRLDCQAPGCGDGVVDTGEGCDDGNAVARDGCDPDCSRAADGARADGGAGSQGSVDAGLFPPDDTGLFRDAGPGVDAGARDAAAAGVARDASKDGGADGSANRPTVQGGGCGCALSGTPPMSVGFWLAAVWGASLRRRNVAGSGLRAP